VPHFQISTGMVQFCCVPCILEKRTWLTEVGLSWSFPRTQVRGCVVKARRAAHCRRCRAAKWEVESVSSPTRQQEIASAEWRSKQQTASQPCSVVMLSSTSSCEVLCLPDSPREDGSATVCTTRPAGSRKVQETPKMWIGLMKTWLTA